ncbi:rhamnan synthesis F family protein [Actinotignum urinale]|uniref:rhamnan synthesis F family protein n=1 Tax=Actinotignum urinale TaxID=190146 RepID=UPI002A810D43|nr:rhamnan synthesis F family protein [Actinotignum urinale]MDY5128634.1 rhamnan synthesis F family protein [Actinotignum urinale]
MKMLENPKRFGIFFFYDGDGVVDGYVDTLVLDMKKNLDELCIVVNGKLNDAGRAKFESWADKLIVRENKGLDAWAYRTALLDAGWDKLSSFDEVVLFNATIMGPVYPFKEMFAEMDSRDTDFWGITWFHKIDVDLFGKTPEGFVPRHIQSHFHAYRRSLITSSVFQEYWENLPEIKDYTDSVARHEVPFTKRFEDLGFVSDVYVNTEDVESYNRHPVLFAPVQLIRDKRCPIFKRRTFFHDYRDVLMQSIGSAPMDLYEYLRDHTDYDVNLIWDNLLRTSNLMDLVRNMKLTYIFPTKALNPPALKRKNNRVALILHVYYMDLLKDLLKYVTSMPEGTDVIFTVGGEEKERQVRRATEGLPYNVIVRQIENRGRDVSALLVGVKDIINDYDLVCFAHDKKVTQLSQGSVGEGFARKCFDNLFPTKEYVENLINKFDEEPRLGMMFPTAPNHGEYFPVYIMSSWGPNFYNTQKLLKKLGANVPLTNSKEPVAPLGTMFWFRPEALKPLYDYDWTYEDFPPEPNNTDGTILHAVERAYAYVPQSEGYFSAYCYSDEFSRLELTNLDYYTQNILRAWQLPMNNIAAGRLPVRVLRKVLPSSAYNQLRQLYRKIRR